MKKISILLTFSSFVLLPVAYHKTCAEYYVEPLACDLLYPETPISRVLRTLKQLYAMLHIMQQVPQEECDDSLSKIIEIQVLSVCGALQEFDRALKEGIHVEDNHLLLVQKLWESVFILVQSSALDSYVMDLFQSSSFNFA